MRAIIIGLLLAVIIGAGGWYIIANQDRLSPSSNSLPDDKNMNTSQATQPPVNSEAVDKLKAGGSSYMDPNGLFTLLYPSDYKVDSPGVGITRIYKQGPTQQGQTEMYDGAIITFETVNLNGQTLSEWVDQQIEQSTSDGTSETLKPKTATTLNSYPGFTYEIRGLGTFQSLVIQKDQNSNSAVKITTLVADPENVGFQEEVNTTLSTLELLK